ncbi:MAG TPA: endonuclease/exonuclease/phosphatase family protein [Solirubrobacteraceae bacterium]|jgi:endonuclease/exonuclease/phosphatase family metal-dependent hydrolase|nr:endonuclease/exonuclease/phosphatase family protein [Solirubrobacteraceae bacterium]
MRVLTWNLYHGRAVPPAGRDLLAEFAAALAVWDWDVALLQEVPPWWPPALAQACDAQQRTVLTSRNSLPALRRAIATRAPDLIKSNGGGANAILVRGTRTVIAHHRLLLRRWPERRVCHAVTLADGTCCANLHAQVHSPSRAGADIARAAAATLAWAAGRPALLGGDFNVRDPTAPGFERLGGRGVDHVLGHGLSSTGEPPIPDRGELSDHVPVLVDALPQRGTASG